MSLDRALTIQELLFNRAIEINKTTQLLAGGLKADKLDLDAEQFHSDPTILEKLSKHFRANWGLYAVGLVGLGLVTVCFLRPKKKKPSKLDF